MKKLLVIALGLSLLGSQLQAFVLPACLTDFNLLAQLKDRDIELSDFIQKISVFSGAPKSLIAKHPKMILMYPLGYHELLRLNMEANIMLTDSGGLQEECTILGTPCLTLRWNTERPITLREHGGASVLVGNNVERIRKEYLHTIQTKTKPIRPELWDGKTAERCLNAILSYSS